MGEAPQETEDCPSAIACDGRCDQHEGLTQAYLDFLDLHQFRQTLARGVTECTCGESNVGDPGWWKRHVAVRLAGVIDIAMGDEEPREVLRRLRQGESYR